MSGEAAKFACKARENELRSHEKNNPPQSPHGFSALAHLYFLATQNRHATQVITPVTTLQNLGSFEVSNTSLQVLATQNPTASQREPSRPWKQCWRKLMTHTVLSFRTGIHLWRKWTCHPCKCSWMDVWDPKFQWVRTWWHVYFMTLKRSSLS